VLRYTGGKEAEVAKTLIDVNEEYLAAAQQVLHAETKNDTVTEPSARSLRWQPGAGTYGGSPPGACPILTTKA
jgi:Arc/MetJ family transcription regulator